MKNSRTKLNCYLNSLVNRGRRKKILIAYDLNNIDFPEVHLDLAKFSAYFSCACRAQFVGRQTIPFTDSENHPQMIPVSLPTHLAPAHGSGFMNLLPPIPSLSQTKDTFTPCIYSIHLPHTLRPYVCPQLPPEYALTDQTID